MNDVPSFIKGTNVVAFEDSGAQSIPAWASSISAGPSDESTQTLSFVVSNNNSNLFSVQPSVAADGTLNFTSSPNTNGSATVTIALRDDGGTANGGVDTSASQTFVITVTSVNDGPTLSSIADTTVLEDSGVQTVVLTGISAGLNESGQSITNFTATSSNPSLLANPSITYTNGNSTALLRFTPLSNASGSAVVTVCLKDNGGTANGGVNLTTATFNINVTAVNDAPAFNTIGNVSAYEGSGTQTVSITGINAGPSDESGQTITLTAISGNTSLIANPVVSFSGGSSATLSYTPPAFGTGTVTITVTAQDNGGVSNSGVDTFSRTFNITLNAINHAPTINAIADTTVFEDGGIQTITLTGISTGLSESAQLITNFVAASSNTNLINNLNVVYTNGNSTAQLRFTSVSNAVGTTTITVQLQDNGGTVSGGINQSSTAFSVTVSPVNDAPSFVKGSDLFVRTSTDPQTRLGWATTITAGPSDESAQNLAFHVTNDNNALFAVQPSISANGTLTFTPITNGTANVSVYLQDDGGSANGGIDISSTETFAITISALNVAPTFSMPTNFTILRIQVSNRGGLGHQYFCGFL